MQFPIGSIIDILNSIICGLCSYILYRAWQRNKTQTVLLYFSRGYFSLVFCYLFFSLPLIFFPDQTTFLGVSFIISQALLYLAVAYFAKVTISLVRPGWAVRVFWTVVAAAAAAVIINIFNFSWPVYDAVAGITDWNISPAVSLASVVIFGGVLAPSAGMFFFYGLRSKEKIVKVRSLLIAAGLVSLVITAYTYYSATSEIVALTSDLFSFLSFLIIFFGVIYKRTPADQNDNSINNNKDK